MSEPATAQDAQILMRTSGGWTKIPRTVGNGQYVSAMLAPNLTCPEGDMGDWHQAGWLMGGTAKVGPWAAWGVLEQDGVHDGRKALRALFAKVQIGHWCWGGHPAGRRSEPVWIACHARAIIDMMTQHLARNE